MQSGRETRGSMQHMTTENGNPSHSEVEWAMNQINVDRNTRDRG